MRKVIDLCLDMPMGAEALTNMLGAMCLDPLYRGYKKTYGAGVAAQVGLTVEEIDAIYESEGRDGFLRIIREAAEKHAVKLAEFVRHLDEVGVEWGITCDGDHDNRKTAELVQAFPKKFKGFIYVDPNKGEEAVRELEMCVKEYGLHALYLTAFRTKLNAADRKNYPLYSKACELGIPVHIYSSLNLSKAVPYDIGHPRYIDQVARDFPELKIMAGVSGWPWVLDFLCLAIRHENVYLNFETHAPEKIAMRGSGYEPYLYYGGTPEAKAPSTTHHRYITEDVPYGLVPLSGLAEKVNVPTPHMDAVITLASTFNGENYREMGRSLKNIGFADKTIEEITHFVYYGE